MKGKSIFLYSLFFLVVIFFIYQHVVGIKWDFMSYVLNAKYIFSQGVYFEWYRPPIAPFMLGVFSLFGWFLTEYIFIVAVTGLHFFASLKFSKKFGIDPLIFYLLTLAPIFFIAGFTAGTELLSLALLLLFFVYLDYGGVFLGIALLTRYQNFMLLPLVLFCGNWKKILKNILYLVLIIFVWFGVDYLITGNFLTSFVDAFALNIKFRGYLSSGIDWLMILFAGAYLWLFAIFGFFKKMQRKLNKIDYAMIAVLLLNLFSFISTPVQIFRYLFLVLIPLAYFSFYIFIDKKYRKVLYITMIILVFFTILMMFIFTPHQDKSIYTTTIKEIDGCACTSNSWVHINYFGYPCLNSPRAELVNDYIDQGYRIVLFYDQLEPQYTFNKTFVQKYLVLMENEDYILLGNKSLCLDPSTLRYNKTYLELLKEEISFAYNYSLDTSNSNILFGKV
jgi:hypothetical protein